MYEFEGCGVEPAVQQVSGALLNSLGAFWAKHATGTGAPADGVARTVR